MLISCGGSSTPAPAQEAAPEPDPLDENIPPINEKIQIDFTFNNGTDGWLSGFADYPVNPTADYQLVAEFSQLPSPLQLISGFNLSGTNRSDDLFMFIKKQFNGFEASTQYQLQFEITFASNEPTGCVGVGGAPGEGVTIKAGATINEPLSADNGNGDFRMNIDKGNQKIDGSDAIKIGDFANSKKCEDKDFTYELKTLNNDAAPFNVFTNTDGALWFLFSTDSGFESTTSIYFISGIVIATKK